MVFRLRLPHLLLPLILGFGSPAMACTCAGGGPACSEAVSPEVSAVFLGTVRSISKPSSAPNLADQRELSATLASGVIEVMLSVEEAYKGVTSGSVVVQTNSSEATCGFPFEKGQQYLVYASEYEGKLFTSICTGTFLARSRARDLKYLKKLKDLPNTSEVFGNYKRYTYDPKFVPKFTPSIMDHYRPPEEYYEAMAPMTGETVTLVSASGRTFRTRVKEDGTFSFTGLAPGKYSIQVSVPAKFAPPTGYVAGAGLGIGSFEVRPKGCAQVIFRTQPDGHIAGRILNAGGRPLPNVELRLWKAGQKFDVDKGYVMYGNNNDDGTFDLGPVPAGKYILAAYVWCLPQGFPNTPGDRNRLTQATLRFFPGTTDPERAEPIILEFGQHISGIELRIPFDPAAWKDIKPAPDD